MKRFGWMLISSVGLFAVGCGHPEAPARSAHDEHRAVHEVAPVVVDTSRTVKHDVIATGIQARETANDLRVEAQRDAAAVQAQAQRDAATVRNEAIQVNREADAIRREASNVQVQPGALDREVKHDAVDAAGAAARAAAERLFK